MVVVELGLLGHAMQESQVSVLQVKVAYSRYIILGVLFIVSCSMLSNDTTDRA